MKEEWRDIKGYEGRYQVSNQGRVKSLSRKVSCIDGRIRNINEKILKNNIGNTGYFYISLSKNSIKKKYLIHKLIAIAFIINPENKKQINHKDGNKLNNNIKNLEWVTQSENTIHAYKNNLINPSKGESHYLTKINEKEAINIHERYVNNEKVIDIAKKYNMSISSINDILNGKSWKYLNIKSSKGKIKGERVHTSKLTENQVLQIRKTKGSYKEISQKFNIPKSTIYNIINRKTWKHI